MPQSVWLDQPRARPGGRRLPPSGPSWQPPLLPNFVSPIARLHCHHTIVFSCHQTQVRLLSILKALSLSHGFLFSKLVTLADEDANWCHWCVRQYNTPCNVEVDYEAEAWSFGNFSLVEILKLKVGPTLETLVWSRFWSWRLVMIGGRNTVIFVETLICWVRCVPLAMFWVYM